MLKPIMNAYRNLYSLNGIWQMRTVDDAYVPTQPAKDTVDVAVPASYNEQTCDIDLRDYVGKVLFEQTFSCPVCQDKQYRIHFNGLSHRGEVYLNGELVAKTNCGYLPVDAEVTLEATNRLSVIIDNRLTYETMPVSQIDEKTGKQILQVDFYNFTGIHRDVSLYTVSKEWIRDITVETFVNDDPKQVKISAEGVTGALVDILDAEGVCVAKGASAGEVITLAEPKLWRVRNAYLYTARVYTDSDEYTLPFGIRKVEVDEKGLYLNGEKVYLKGYGRHEDFYVSGRGTNLPVLVRDFNLMNWTNANSFRTSHYPYGDEAYEMADKMGYLVIDEVPNVGMNWVDDMYAPGRVDEKTLAVHKEYLEQMIARDKNHPCVVMVSISNEPDAAQKGAREYFQQVAAYARTLTKLPLTLAEFTPYNEDTIGDLVDVICINRYFGWYYDHGDLRNVEQTLREDLQNWYEKYHKPMIVSEFGADAIEGNHCFPAETFSEEYQRDIIDLFCKAFDSVDCCIGEQVWNFADFKTKQGLNRVRGNRKGVFSKDRQPKLAAHYLKQRWENK